MGSLIGFALLGVAHSKIKIDPMKHDVTQVFEANFDSYVKKFRDSSVAVTLYHDGHLEDDYFTKYNAVATALKGIVKVTIFDCSADKKAKEFCEREGATTCPAIMVYPVLPQPAYAYTKDVEKLKNHLSTKIPNKADLLTDEKFDEWATIDASKPKVVLFSEKESVPTILKALSSETVFKRTVKFGLLSSNQTKTHAKYLKGKKLPALLMIRGAKAEIQEWYKGELTFEEIKNWVNLYSESGVGDTVHGVGGEASAEEAKPWLVADIPELTAKSYMDICFKSEGLCVIHLNDGPTLDPKSFDMLKSLKDKYTSHLSGRGTVLKWMWIDLKIEETFNEMFGKPEFPGVVVFNPHKRLRWVKHDGVASENSINALLDKILGGDAKFTMVKGGKLPAWATRDAKKDKKEEL